jgi:hypothetical protein
MVRLCRTFREKCWHLVRGRKANLAPSGHLVKKANQVLRDLLARQVLPRTPLELSVWTARAQRAEGSATKTRYL